MLNIYTVSFFGHRYVEGCEEIEIRLGKLLREFITQKEYIEFLIWHRLILNYRINPETGLKDNLSC